MKSHLKVWHLAASAVFGVAGGAAASAQGCHDARLEPVQLREHEAQVELQLGFSRTEVTQRLFNPNAGEAEAILHLPLAEDAAVAEVEFGNGLTRLQAESVAADRAEAAFGEERVRGAGALIARRIENGDLEIRIARLAPQSEAYVRCVTYAPQATQGGAGRYEYPARGATALPGREIWTPETELRGRFRLTVDVRHNRPLAELAAPGFEGVIRVEALSADHHRLVLEAEPGEAGPEAVVTYRLEEPAEGAVDLVAYRPGPERGGVFMMAFTPAAGFTAAPVNGARPVLHFPGGRVSQTTELGAEPLERGEQLIVFGLYQDGGRNRVVLNNGAAPGELEHDSIVTFPARDDEFPELERLWAQGRASWLASLERDGVYAAEAVREAEEELGLEYQILTRSTAMLALETPAFAERAILPANADRVTEERAIQALREDAPVWQTRVDLADAFFAARGRREGECCRIGEDHEALAAYGLDLSTPSQVAQ